MSLLIHIAQDSQYNMRPLFRVYDPSGHLLLVPYVSWRVYWIADLIALDNMPECYVICPKELTNAVL